MVEEAHGPVAVPRPQRLGFTGALAPGGRLELEHRKGAVDLTDGEDERHRAAHRRTVDL